MLLLEKLFPGVGQEYRREHTREKGIGVSPELP
jgi:hypothetical protein